MEWLDRLKDNNSRLTRWSLALQPYQYKVEYRAGSSHANADALDSAEDNASQEKGEGPNLDTSGVNCYDSRSVQVLACLSRTMPADESQPLRSLGVESRMTLMQSKYI